MTICPKCGSELALYDGLYFCLNVHCPYTQPKGKEDDRKTDLLPSDSSAGTNKR